MKRNCRRTDDERDQHDRATRIRKMTDAQICSYIDGLEQKAASVAAAPKKTEDAIRHFVDSLAVRTDRQPHQRCDHPKNPADGL